MGRAVRRAETAPTRRTPRTKRSETLVPGEPSGAVHGQVGSNYQGRNQGETGGGQLVGVFACLVGPLVGALVGLVPGVMTQGISIQVSLTVTFEESLGSVEGSKLHRRERDMQT